LFKTIANAVAAPVRACSLPVRILEHTTGLPKEETIADQVADAIVEVGEDMDDGH
jgi:hypothetical protein